jgi:hypothetical protein
MCDYSHSGTLRYLHVSSRKTETEDVGSNRIQSQSCSNKRKGAQAAEAQRINDLIL